MTGTQSLSFAQLHAIMDEVNRIEIAARRGIRYRMVNDQRVYRGQPVTIVVSQAEPFIKADKRVDIHRADAESETLWIERDGKINRFFSRVNEG